MTRQRWLVVVLTAVLAEAVQAADPPADTKAAAFTRTKKLKGTVTVELADRPLSEIVAALTDQLQDQKLGPIICRYDDSATADRKTSLSVKGVTAEEALDKLLGSLDLGYVIVSKEKSREDGYLRIVAGTARGYEPGTEPKAAPPKPVASAADDANKRLGSGVKFDPATKAAADAKLLLDGMK